MSAAIDGGSLVPKRAGGASEQVYLPVFECPNTGSTFSQHSCCAGNREQAMPRDEWKRERDREIARRASQEYAQHGHLMSFERFDDDLAPEPAFSLMSKDDQRVVNWLNKWRAKSNGLANSIPPFAEPPKSNDATSIPLILDALRQENEDDKIISKLVRVIGKPAIIAFMRELESGSEPFKRRIVTILVQQGKEAFIAAGQIEKLARNGSKDMRKFALESLLRMQKLGYKPPRFDVKTNSAVALVDSLIPTDLPLWEGAKARIILIGPTLVPDLVKLLRNGNLLQRRNAALALGFLGPAAWSALPELAKAIKDSDDLLREKAREAVKKIRPHSVVHGASGGGNRAVFGEKRRRAKKGTQTQHKKKQRPRRN